MGEGQTPQNDEKEIRNVFSFLSESQKPTAPWGPRNPVYKEKCRRGSRNLPNLWGPLNLAVPSPWNCHLLVVHMAHFLTSFRSQLKSSPRPSLPIIPEQHRPPWPCSPEPRAFVSSIVLVTRQTYYTVPFLFTIPTTKICTLQRQSCLTHSSTPSPDTGAWNAVDAQEMKKDGSINQGT